MEGLPLCEVLALADEGREGKPVQRPVWRDEQPLVATKTSAMAAAKSPDLAGIVRLQLAQNGFGALGQLRAVG